jgi:hypothetical protein
MLKISACVRCKNKLGTISIPKKGMHIHICKAFPKGIPEDIYHGPSRHFASREGQVGNFLLSPDQLEVYHLERTMIKEIISEEETIKAECLTEFQALIKKELEATFKWEKAILIMVLNSDKRSVIIKYPEKSLHNARSIFFVREDGYVEKKFIYKDIKAYRLAAKLLLIQNRQHHKRTLKLTLFSNGTSNFEFTDEHDDYNLLAGEHSRIRCNLNEELLSKWNREAKNKDLKAISYEKAEKVLTKIHDEYEKYGISLPLSNNHISLIFEEKGYLFLRSQINKLKFLIRLRLMLMCLQNFND